MELGRRQCETCLLQLRQQTKLCRLSEHFIARKCVHSLIKTSNTIENGKNALARYKSGKGSCFGESFLSQNYLVQIEGHVHFRPSSTGLTAIHETVCHHEKGKNQGEGLHHPNTLQEALTSDESCFPR